MADQVSSLHFQVDTQQAAPFQDAGTQRHTWLFRGLGLAGVVLLGVAACVLSPPLLDGTDMSMALAFNPSAFSRHRQSSAWVTPATSQSTPVRKSSAPPQMGLFDTLKNAFANNEQYSSSAEDAREATRTRATASHILTATEGESQGIKEQIAAGLPFEEAAMKFSTCASSARGGALGKFGPGTMVKEFDDVIFGLGESGDKPEYPVGEVIGPVRTKFGYHLIKIASRNMPKIGYKD